MHAQAEEEISYPALLQAGIAGPAPREPARHRVSVSHVLGVDVTGHDYHDVVPGEVFERSKPEGRKIFEGVTETTRRTVEGDSPITS
ncbi:hypothetical protein ACW2Q0_07930 [Nocardia sp. R16R-3T]